MKKLERKRMTKEQKYEAVRMLLSQALYTMSAHEIGKRLGFANGIPVYETLEQLKSEGKIASVKREYRGAMIDYWHDVRFPVVHEN